MTASFECRQVMPSPCTGGKGHRAAWSMHACGLAVDVNPEENPYVGCGQEPRPHGGPYRDRSRHLKEGWWTPARGRGVPGRRVGLGRSLGRQHEGLHALLFHRPLDSRSG